MIMTMVMKGGIGPFEGSFDSRLVNPVLLGRWILAQENTQLPIVLSDCGATRCTLQIDMGPTVAHMLRVGIAKQQSEYYTQSEYLKEFARIQNVFSTKQIFKLSQVVQTIR